MKEVLTIRIYQTETDDGADNVIITAGKPEWDYQDCCRYAEAVIYNMSGAPFVAGLEDVAGIFRAQFDLLNKSGDIHREQRQWINKALTFPEEYDRLPGGENYTGATITKEDK